MVLYRFLFAPVLLAVATFLGAGERSEPRERPAAATAPREAGAERRPSHVNAAPVAPPIAATR
jgi:hypothetical protein